MKKLDPNLQDKLYALNNRIDELLYGEKSRRKGNIKHKIEDLGYQIISTVIEPLLKENNITYRFEESEAGNALLLSCFVNDFDENLLEEIFDGEKLIGINSSNKSVYFIVWFE